jgi:hypothetical protein
MRMRISRSLAFTFFRMLSSPMARKLEEEKRQTDKHSPHSDPHSTCRPRTAPRHYSCELSLALASGPLLFSRVEAGL